MLNRLRKKTTIALTFCLVFLVGITGCTSTPTMTKKVTSIEIVERIKPVSLSEMNNEQRSLLGIIEGQPLPKRAKTNLFRTLVRNHDLLTAYQPLGDAMSKAPAIIDKDRELVIMRVAWIYQAEYEWAQHYKPAINAGWSAEQIERIKAGSKAPQWNDFERTLLNAADELVANSFLEDSTWEQLQTKYTVEDIMVLMTVVSHYHWVAMMTKTLGIQLENGKSGFKR